MDLRNSQDNDHHNNEEENKKKKEDKMFAKLYDIFFPSDHHQQQQQQPSQQQLITTVANQILPPASPPLLELAPTTVDVAAADLAEQRRWHEEALVIRSLEAQRQLLLWEYWQNWEQMQRMQQVNRLLQNPQQITIKPTTNIRKKKRLEKKDMVYMVPGANIQAVDRWAWRKYGQKPIKGSTFPRSYYKCSTSKGCKAKKQVEQVLLEPEVYMVTYKGEHFHPNPVQLAHLPASVLVSLPVCDLPNHLRLPPPPDQLPPPSHEKPLALLPTPPETASLAAEEEEGLLIPNLMVDEDMMSSREELKKFGKRYNDLGDGPSSSPSGSGSSGPGFY